MKLSKIGFGGGCHWCTEAVFQAINGVLKVEQGWISSTSPQDSFSEGVIVHFREDIIDLGMLISVHLNTHSSTSNHSMRNKYRSAVYAYSNHQVDQVSRVISSLQNDFNEPIIAQALLLQEFKLNKETYLDYYKKNRENQFCKTYINPKLNLLDAQYSHLLKTS